MLSRNLMVLDDLVVFHLAGVVGFCLFYIVVLLLNSVHALNLMALEGAVLSSHLWNLVNETNHSLLTH